ncbi:MAG: uroporphyrinogen-III synthase [Campylobacterales bacterium]|nr:uroporphyrinogen-III synthase [Campylobacterales bacterium]
MSKKIYLFSTSSHPETIHINSLDTKFLTPEINFSKYDHLIITSKQVALALGNYNQESYKNISALCVSQQSAKSFEKIGGQILEVGQGYGDNLEEIITHYPKNTRWIYLRAKEVASDFAFKSREKGYKVDEAIIYETFCSEAMKNANIENDAILIFTSPSSVKCYLKNHTFKKEHKIVVIGKTTAKSLPENTECVISYETTIESCIKIAKTL